MPGWFFTSAFLVELRQADGEQIPMNGNPNWARAKPVPNHPVEVSSGDFIVYTVDLCRWFTLLPGTPYVVALKRSPSSGLEFRLQPPE